MKLSNLSLKKTLFGKDDSTRTIETLGNIRPTLNSYILSISDSVYNCATGARCCYGGTAYPSYNKNFDLLEKVIGYGHDSVSAHSNILLLFEVTSAFNSIYPDLIKILPAMRFMNIEVISLEQNEEPNYTELDEVTDPKVLNYDKNYILIGGSIRAYRYFVEKCFLNGIPENSGILYKRIISCIYQSIDACFFSDFFKKGILDKAQFMYLPETKELSEDVYDTYHYQELNDDDVVQIVNFDSLQTIYSKITDLINPESLEDKKKIFEAILNTSVITLKLQHYSRAISQQINRHLSGISQESQRYVDYSKTKFIDPTKFNSKKYTDPNAKYNIKDFDNLNNHTSQEIGDKMIGIYQSLKDDGMINQDARGYLPMNVETKAIHTFTYQNLLHFIKLRTSSAAQPEVQYIANDMKKLIQDVVCKDIMDEDFVQYIESKMK